MKNFWKFLGITVAVFAAVVGALVVVDRIINRNRLEDDYLQCDVFDEVA